MKRITQVAFLSLAVFALVLPAVAQDRKKLSADEQGQYVVSAKAGIVSIVDGEVLFKRGKSDWQPIIEGDELKAADVVKTGASGRIEILLNPGTYLRLAENSELAFNKLTSFMFQMKLSGGSAILEAGVIDTDIKFATPQYDFTFTRQGLYRFNTEANVMSEMLIRKGKVNVAGAEIKDGKKVVVLEKTPPAIQAFDKKTEDSFDIWSKDRAKAMVAANKQLSNKRMQSSLVAGSYNNLWVYDPWNRLYTFLPGWTGCGSPYGWGYSYFNPYWYYNPWFGGGWRNNGGVITGGSGNHTGNGSPGAGGTMGGSRSGSSPTVTSQPLGSPRVGNDSGRFGGEGRAPATGAGGGGRAHNHN